MSDNPHQTTLERVLNLDRKQIEDAVARYMRGAEDVKRRLAARTAQTISDGYPANSLDTSPNE